MAIVLAGSWGEKKPDTRGMTQYDAEQDAAKAAARARAAVGAVDSVADLRRVADLFSQVWAAPQAPPMPHDIMRSLVHAGGGSTRLSGPAGLLARRWPCSDRPPTPDVTR